MAAENPTPQASSSSSSPSSSTSSLTTKIRILYFFFYASISTVCPFQSLYLSTKGLHSTHIGWVSSINPLLTLLVAKSWGRYADAHTPMSALLLSFTVCNAVRILVPLVCHDMRLLIPVKIVEATFYAPVKSLMDGLILDSLSTANIEKEQFGRLRLFGQVGTGLSSAIMVKVMATNPLGYDIIYIASSLLAIPAVACMLSFRAHQHSTTNGHARTNTKTKTKGGAAAVGDTYNDGDSSQKEHKSISCLAKDARFAELFTLVLLGGFSFGFIETFNYPAVRKFYKSVGSEASLGTDMMLGRICISIAGISMYWNSGRIVKALGHVTVLHCTMLSLTILYLLYGQVDGDAVDGETRLCFLLGEATRGATFAMFMSTAVGYAHAISPPSLKATVLQLIEATYRGVGFMSGGIIGGRLIASYPSTAYAFHQGGRVSLSLFLSAFVAAKVFIGETYEGRTEKTL